MSDEANNAAAKAREKIIDKVAKLLGMANQPLPAGASEAVIEATKKEAMKAAALAQELLAKYNIEMSEIGAVKDPMIRDNDLLTARAGWVKPLMGAVAKLYFCGYYYESFPAEWIKRNGFDKNARKLKAGGMHRIFYRHNFIGQRVNILVAKNMADYLITTLERLCDEAEKLQPKEERTSYRYSFMNAAVSWLCFRLLERKRETSSVGDVKSNLPVLRSVYEQAEEAVKAFLEANETKLTNRKNMTKIHNQRGARDGSEAGKGIGLDDQIANTRDKGRMITSKGAVA